MKKTEFLAEISSDARVESIVYVRGYYKLSLKDEYKPLAKLADELKQLFIVAKVELVDDDTLEEYDTCYIKVEKFNGHQCPRCWNYFEENEMDGELCCRCADIMHRVAQ